jgi:GNAT superfamily N-acetyltransferase
MLAPKPGSRHHAHEKHPGFLRLFDDLLDDETRSTLETAAARAGLRHVLVATDPEWQRRGYGEAVTHKSLYEAARATGLIRAMLHASEAAAPLYPRIGFKPTSPIHF